MVDIKTLFAIVSISIIIDVAASQDRYQNPAILRERRKCALVVVRPMPVNTDTRNPFRRMLITNRGPILGRPPTRIIRPFIRRNTGPVRSKRHAKDPPSRPPMPSRINLPNRGIGIPPKHVQVPITGFGSQLPSTQAIQHRNTSQFGNGFQSGLVPIPIIPNNNQIQRQNRNAIQMGSIRATRNRARGQKNLARSKTLQQNGRLMPLNQIKVPAIPNTPENRIEDDPVVQVPVAAPRLRVPLSPRINIKLPCEAARRVCGWELEKKCRLPPCPTKPACVKRKGPTNKPGRCPEFIKEYLTNGFNIRYCFDDSNCRGKQICCHGKGSNGGSACVNPVFPSKNKII